MIRGLQIRVRGDELRRRIGERVNVHQAAFDAITSRIKKREGDQPHDVRVDDGMTTLGDLESEREDCRTRLTRLALIRDGLDPGEVYTLTLRDLRLADLAPTGTNGAESDQEWLNENQPATVNGLRLTMAGEEVRRLLAERIEVHEKRAVRWNREGARTLEDQTEDHPLLPGHICENEAEREEWLVETLTFIREHVESDSVYRLAKGDLVFAELLPEKPGWLEQEEYEERNALRFHVEQVARGKVGPVAATFSVPSDPGESDQA